MLDRREFLQSAGLLSGAVRTAGAAGAAIPLISFRIGTDLWLTDARVEELLHFFATRKGTVDELAFFTAATHPPRPLEEMRQKAARLARIMPLVRQQGMRAGINILATIGHHEENLDHSLNTSWQRVVDPWGKVSRGAYCPAQPPLLEYVRQIYSSMADAHPDFLWIDDDVRLAGHGPTAYNCFCELCLRNFSEETGERFTRESLLAACDSGSLQDKLAIRRKWLEHNRRTIDHLFQVIETTVHARKPDLSLGFMTGDRFYEGYDFARWAKTLAGPRQVPVRWRPGGGFYSDEALMGLVDKAHAIGRQVSALPAGIAVIQSELENFPYQRLRKAARTTVIEAAAEMAAGSTGTAFNVLTMTPDPLPEYVPLYDQIAGFRPLWARMQAELGRSTVRGVWPAWNRDVFAAVNPGGPWLAGGKLAFHEAYSLAEIGLPLAYGAEGASVTALCGSTVLAFSQEELRRIFSGGVLLDVDAWRALKELGLSAWTGVQEVSGVDHDAIEALTADSLNGRFAGWSRDCRQSFWWQRAYRLEPFGTNVRMLARLTNYASQDLGPCMAAFPNPLGGRVVTMGYYPWSQFHSLAKSSQMKSVCRWLSRGRLPVAVESYARTVLWYRDGMKGRRGVFLINASLDPLPNLTLAFADKLSSCVHLTEDGRERAASVTGGSRVVVSDLAPWSVHLLLGSAP